MFYITCLFSEFLFLGSSFMALLLTTSYIMLDNYLIVKMLMVGIIATLIILKTFLFLKTPGRKNLKSWFYYSVYQLVNAKSKKNRNCKKNAKCVYPGYYYCCYCNLYCAFFIQIEGGAYIQHFLAESKPPVSYCYFFP